MLPAACVEEIREVLGRQVAGCSGGVRTAAGAARRGIEAADPGRESGDDVGQCRSACVVKVERDLFDRYTSEHVFQHTGDLCGMRDADRVAHRDFEHAHLNQLL